VRRSLCVNSHFDDKTPIGSWNQRARFILVRSHREKYQPRAIGERVQSQLAYRLLGKLAFIIAVLSGLDLFHDNRPDHKRHVFLSETEEQPTRSSTQ